MFQFPKSPPSVGATSRKYGHLSGNLPPLHMNKKVLFTNLLQSSHQSNSLANREYGILINFYICHIGTGKYNMYIMQVMIGQNQGFDLAIQTLKS